jgi:hypothetical protein
MYKKKLIKNNENNIDYTEEEAAMLGIELENVNHEDENEDEEDFIEETEDEKEEDVVEKNTSIDYDKKRKKKKSEKEKHYVDPKEFDNEITIYYESNKLSNTLAEMVSKIANKLSYAPNFINYSYREEMVGDGIIRMFKALMSKKYNHKKGTNPFSYFTRIAFNAFRNRIKKEKHIHETHEKYKNDFLMLSESCNSTTFKNGNAVKRRDQ